MEPAVSLLEFSSIAKGIEAGDAMVKRAPLDVIDKDKAKLAELEAGLAKLNLVSGDSSGEWFCFHSISIILGSR